MILNCVDIYGRYHVDTFIPWLHGIDNLSNFKQALDEHIKSIYPNINFTMVYDYKEIQFLDLTVYVENSFLKTETFFLADRQPRVFRCTVIAPIGSI